MLSALNIKAVFKSSLNPVVPLVTGVWNVKAASKWRGVASELTYNSYLRNGWVTIDTGVKGTAGTPFIEFSCWEFGESRYVISLPNVMSFKFFLQGSTWNSRFITRTSVVAQEAWFGEQSEYSQSIHSYAVGSTLRKRDKLTAFFYSVAYLTRRFIFLSGESFNFWQFINQSQSLKFGGLIGYRSNIIYSKRIILHKKNKLFFDIFDKGALNLMVSAANNIEFLYFNNLFFKKLKNKLLINSKVTGQRFICDKHQWISFRDNFSKSKSFFDVLFRLNLFILGGLEFKGNLDLNAFFYRVLVELIRDFFLVFGLIGNKSGISFNTFAEKSLFDARVNMVAKKFVIFLDIAKLTPINLIKVFLSVLFNFFAHTGKYSFNFPEVSVNKAVLFARKLRGYNLSSLFLEETVFKNATHSKVTFLPLDTFFASYARIKRRKHFQIAAGLKIKRKYKPWLRYKRKRVRNSGRGNLTSNYAIRAFRWKPWRKLVSYLKLSVERKQFLFLYFWSINFFNFWVSKNSSQLFFYSAVRLIYFFKNFFKFYTFYINLLKLVTATSSRNILSRGQLFVAFKTYLFVLHTKFSRVLLAFYSLCNKLFKRRWAVLLNRSASTLAGVVKRLAALAPVSRLQFRNVNGITPVLSNLLSYLVKTYIWTVGRGGLGAIHSTGYSRAYFQFLIGLRNKSIKLSSRFLDTAFHNNLVNPTMVSNTSLTNFFVKFKLFLQRIRGFILSCVLKRLISRRQFDLFFYKRVFLFLSKFSYDLRSSALLNTTKMSVFAKRLSFIILNMFARKRTSKKLNSAELKQVLNLANLFVGNKLGISSAVLINKYLVNFFRWVRKFTLYVNVKRAAYKVKFFNYLFEVGGVKNQFKRVREFKNVVSSLAGSSLSRVLTILHFARRLVINRARSVLSNVSVTQTTINKAAANRLHFRDLAYFGNHSITRLPLGKNKVNFLANGAAVFFDQLLNVKGSGFLQAVVSKNLTLSYRFVKFFKLNQFSSLLSRNAFKSCFSTLFACAKNWYYLGWGTSLVGLHFANCRTSIGLRLDKTLWSTPYNKTLLPFTRNLFEDKNSCILLETTRYFDVSARKNWLGLYKLLGLRVDFLSFGNKEVLGLLAVAQQRVFVLGEYFTRSQAFFFKNLYSGSAKYNYNLYKHAYTAKELKTTRFNLGVDLTFWFKPYIKTSFFFFKEILFLNNYLFTRSSFTEVRDSRVARNGVAFNKNTLVSFSLKQKVLGLFTNCNTSSFFSRGLIYFWYTKYITSWAGYLTAHMYIRKKRVYSRKKKALHFFLNFRNRSLIRVNQFCVGKMRRLSKTIGISSVLPVAGVIVVGNFNGHSNILVTLPYSNIRGNSIGDKHCGLKALVVKSIGGVNKLQSFLQPIGAVNQAYCVGYFLKFSYYLLNYRRITNVVFGGTFYRWFEPVCAQFWNNVRAIRKLKLLPNARKVGLFPRFKRSSAGFNKKYFGGKNSRKNMKIVHYDGWHNVSNASFRNNLMPSMFSKDNFLSMQLAYETVKPKFRFINLKELRLIKRLKRRLLKFVIRYRFGRLRKRRQFKIFRRFFRHRRIKFFKRRYGYHRRIRLKLRRLIQKFFVKAVTKLNFIGRRRLFLGESSYLAGLTRIRLDNLGYAYNSRVLYSRVVSRYLSGVYYKFIWWRKVSCISFFKNSKFRFLFILMRTLFNKTYNHLINFIHFFNFNSLLSFSLKAVFNHIGTWFLKFSVCGGFSIHLDVLNISVLSQSYKNFGIFYDNFKNFSNPNNFVSGGNIFWGPIRSFFSLSTKFFGKFGFLPKIEDSFCGIQFFIWRKPIYTEHSKSRAHIFIMDRGLMSFDFARKSLILRSSRIKSTAVMSLLGRNLRFSKNLLSKMGRNVLSFLKFQGLPDARYEYLVKKLFNINANLGLVKDYKLLRGNTVNQSSNSVRVYQNFKIKRPLNYKTSSWVDLGSVSSRFTRRAVAFRRKTYGPLRNRWFRWA